MAILSERYRYLFIQVGATACTAVAEGVLIPHLDGRPFPDTQGIELANGRRVSAKHATLPVLIREGLITEARAEELFTFATVRNPYDHEHSQYTKMRNMYAGRQLDEGFAAQRPQRARTLALSTDHPFDEWLARRYRHMRPELVWRRRVRRTHRPLFEKWHLRGMDFVMRYEHLQADFDEVVRRLGIDGRYEIPLTNVTPGRDRDYRRYYTPRARRIVEYIYRWETETFGYEF